MKWLVQISVSRPKTVLAVIASITVFFAVMLAARFSVNVDPMKSFSRKMDVIKYYHLTLKKFSMKDMILIGVENSKEGIFNVQTLRYVERVIDEFRKLKVRKTYHNIITGRDETVEVPSKLTPGQIMSVINADDVMVNKATNTIVVGNLTSKAREKAGMVTDDPEEMKKLPASDEELKKLIPYLQKELMGNELLKGTLFSADGMSCAIMVPVEKRIDNKLEIIRRELPLMISAERLRDRFMGKDYYFPANIYQKKVDGTLVDDEFIHDTVEKNKKSVRAFFVRLLEPIGGHYADFYQSLKNKPIDDRYLADVFRMIESDAVYEKPGVELTYQDCIDELYRFLLSHMDRFSRNNLESKLYNVPGIYDVGYLYKLFNEITERNKPSDLTIYIAGMPIAEALLQEYVINDMSVFMALTALVILVILFLTIRTPTGIYLPLSSVIIGIIWLMGGMLLAGIEFSSGTIAMPCILIAVGSSYVIHFLIRYYEKVAGRGRDEVKAALLETTDSIEAAIFLSAVTTMAAFLSDIFIDVIDIQYLGILVTIGIAINFILTFTFIPAALALQAPPKGTTETMFERFIMSIVLRGGDNTARHSKAVFWGAFAISAVFLVGMFFLKTESSSSVMFLDESPIRKADKFINRELTGTGQMCIVFKMRDQVNLSNAEARRDLVGRISQFTASYRNILALHPDLAAAAALNKYFIDDLNRLAENPARAQNAIETRVGLFTDILNEYYEKEPEKKEKAAERTTAVDDLSALGDDYRTISGLNTARTPQDEGIDDIVSRIPDLSNEADKEAARRFIRSIRNYKNDRAGKEFQGSFYALSDFFHTDITQPITLRKIDELGKRLKELKEPRAVIDGVAVSPVGNIMSVTDTLKVIYKVFYHEDDEAFRKIPNVKQDGIADPSLTDRSVIGVCMNQFRASREDIFKYLVTDDYKLMQYVVFTRSDKAEFLSQFQNTFNAMFRSIFPEDDPYVEKIVISGIPAINLEMNRQILVNQIQSVVVTLIVVFISCIFIFRSFVGGLFVSVPITFTLVITLGVMGYLGIPINYSTLVNASIAVGVGIDYCIHFIERFKHEHTFLKYDFNEAYRRTLKTTGLSIVTATLTVGLGFAVLGFSSFKIVKVSGLLVTLSMVLSGALSLSVLPAMIIWAKPKFLQEIKPWGIEEKVKGVIERVMEEMKNRFGSLMQKEG